MARELLIEIGCEELPASWLPSLTRQLGDVLAERIAAAGLDDGHGVETFGTPRRLVAAVPSVLGRQNDREETVMGPPVSAAIGANGEPTKAGLGFARKLGVPIDSLERIDTGKGIYLGARRTVAGLAAVEVLPVVLSETLRRLSFPKKMHWDARLDDGKGDLLFGRPIRWLLFLHDGQVVPFVIQRTPAAACEQVRDVRAGAMTYGHRFLAGPDALPVASIADFRRQMNASFVELDREARRTRIATQLESLARAHGGQVWLPANVGASVLDEVPDLVEYPTVIAGRFAPSFLDLPNEVLATAMIHHQHYVPVADATGRLTGGFLAITDTDGDKHGRIAANAERVLTARLRDAEFFWRADRAHGLESNRERLGTLAFHARLGTYLDKVVRLERLARWTASEALGRPDAADTAGLAAGLAKLDLTTQMVREFTELQGVMGGIYARAEGHPEEVWKAVYHQYLPIGVEREAPPSRSDLGGAGACWAALVVADRIDTLVGLHAAGERPSGTRDPFGMRRHAQGLMKVLVDLPELVGTDAAPTLELLVGAAASGFGNVAGAADGLGPQALAPLYEFLVERLRHLCAVRGLAYDEINAVLAPYHERLGDIAPADIWCRVTALHGARPSDDLDALAVLFKRVKNITRELDARPMTSGSRDDLEGALTDAAERDLLRALRTRDAGIREAMRGRDYRQALAVAAELRPAVDRFFTEVFVMVEDERLRGARLRLLANLRDLILELADLSELVPHSDTET